MSARLGLTLTADGGEIAVVSQNATKLFVCLFDAAGATETGRVELQRAADGVFRATLPGLKPVSRFQLAFAILMYLGSPAWMAMMALGVVAIASGTTP